MAKLTWTIDDHPQSESILGELTSLKRKYGGEIKVEGQLRLEMVEEDLTREEIEEHLDYLREDREHVFELDDAIRILAQMKEDFKGTTEERWLSKKSTQYSVLVDPRNPKSLYAKNNMDDLVPDWYFQKYCQN